jgi:hypothetical protein
MTKYTDIIPLEEAKLYLKIDSSQTQTDAEITGMINSACAYIEQRTGWIFFERSKKYFGRDFVTVYDCPIKTLPIHSVQKNQYSIVPTNNGEVTLEIGCQSKEEIPPSLLDCALQIINFWFYNQETNGAENSIPNFVAQNIDTFRRFV